MAEIKYEVIEHIGVLSESAKGWKKELNRISWNGATPKYDIREWAPGREKLGSYGQKKLTRLSMRSFVGL